MVNDPYANYGVDFARQMRQMSERQEWLNGRVDAEEAFKYITSRLKEFQNTLDESEELGVQLANFGLAAELHVRTIGYRNPNLIEFHGIDMSGNFVVLVQHISQLSFMLKAIKPIDEKPYRIGFR